MQSGTVLTAAASGSTAECDLGTSAYSPITAANTASCSGSVLPGGTAPGQLATSAGSTKVSADGSVSPASASLVTGACGPVQLANTAMTSDPLLVRGDTFSYNQSGPPSLAGSAALGMSGASAYATDVTSVAGPSTTSFTELIWFKATTAGTLIGFNSSATNQGSVNWDKMLWVDNTGHVVFGVYPSGTVEVTSTKSTYLDGNWHLAVATLSATSGLSLYVDGAVAGTNTSTKTAQAYNGYWHVGWDNESSGWSDPPTNPYFAGSLTDAAVLPAALTAAQVTSLFAVTTQTAWNTAVSSYSPTDAWPLGDSGATAFQGTVPGVTPAPCAFIDVTVGISSPTASCSAPAGASACGAPSGTTTLTTISSKTTALAIAPTLTAPITIVATIERDVTNTTTLYPNAAGLHLTMPMSVVSTSSGFTATLYWPSENVEL